MDKTRIRCSWLGTFCTRYSQAEGNNTACVAKGKRATIYAVKKWNSTPGPAVRCIWQARGRFDAVCLCWDLGDRSSELQDAALMRQ